MENFYNKNNKLNIPKIIIIGNDTKEKVLLLENIIKCKLFPYNNKITTPIHFILSKSENINYNIEYTNKIINIKNKDDIYNIILENTNSENQIKISLSEPNLYDFEFYYLPNLENIINNYLVKDNIILYIENNTFVILTNIEKKIKSINLSIIEEDYYYINNNIDKICSSSLINDIKKIYNDYIYKIWKPEIIQNLNNELDKLGIIIDNDINKNEIIDIIINIILNKTYESLSKIIFNYDILNKGYIIQQNNRMFDINYVNYYITNNLDKYLEEEYKYIIDEYNILDIIREIDDIKMLDNKLYNLYRFNNLKNKIILYINNKIKELLIKENEKIYLYIYDSNINNIDNYKDIEQYYQTLLLNYNKLIKFFIIYPLFIDIETIKTELFDNLNYNDFEEDFETLEKRKLYKNNINYINNLFNQNTIY
jgi:hypothetical protein